MPNAFTFDDGSPRSFKTRAAMYDWMAENGHVIAEGDDAPKFESHVRAKNMTKAIEKLAEVQLAGQVK